MRTRPLPAPHGMYLAYGRSLPSWSASAGFVGQNKCPDDQGVVGSEVVVTAPIPAISLEMAPGADGWVGRLRCV